MNTYQDERLYERQWEAQGWAEDCEHGSPACAECADPQPSVERMVT